jgi:hypothetical protein
MIKVVDIKAVLAGRAVLRARSRFDAPAGVTVLSATPQPTEHTSAADPRATRV